MLVVFGSLNADLVFVLERLPRPGETVLCPGYSWAPGGKGGNQAVAAARSGAAVAMAGRVGDDGHGAALRAHLEAQGVDCRHLGRSARPTGTAIIGVERSGENSIIVASGANLDVAADDLHAVAFARGDTLLCQNEVPLQETLAALARAHAAGATTVLNLAPVTELPAAAWASIGALVLNEHEAAVLTGEADPLTALPLLAGRCAITVITLGAAGVLLAAPGLRVRQATASVEVVDTTGAGDAFVGVLAAGLDAGLEPLVATRRATAAGALACTALGAQAALPDDTAITATLARLEPAQALG